MGKYNTRNGRPPMSSRNLNVACRSDFCPKCVKRYKIAVKVQRLGGLYKSLCRNPNCTVHKRAKCPNLEHNCRKVRRKLNNKLIKRIINSSGTCRVREFEDGGCDALKNIDPTLYSRIQGTIVDITKSNIRINDVLGQSDLKQTITRTIIWPMKKPEIFNGLRSAPKGVLFFGPPGTGKTLIGQWIALETQSTFFNVTPASLTSKFTGDSENLVRTMFIVARARQPSVIFIDEVDSLLAQRTPNEKGTTLRMKNEFLVQMDGADTVEHDRVMVVGATNRPEEIDAAIRRRFVKRVYVPLPGPRDRKQLLSKFMSRECHSLEKIHIEDIAARTEGFSGADLKTLCHEAAMGPIKAVSSNAILHLDKSNIRPISITDFLEALERIKPTVSKDELRAYEKWNCVYGYCGKEYTKPAHITYKKPTVEDNIPPNPYIT